MTKFICTKCKNIVTNIGKINFVTVANSIFAMNVTRN